MKVEKSDCFTVDDKGRTLLASSISKSLMAMQVALAMGGLAFAGAALAQTDTSPPTADTTTTATATKTPAENKPTKDKAVSLKQVSVTGSNIRSVDVEAAQPVISITAQDIQKQGFATVGQLLQNVSSMSPPDLSHSAPGDLGPNQGGSFVDLRGLGAPRTLVLVDGQRIGAAHGGYTNINVIPTAIVERIDVLASGASAVYGSDAIAGVINIITKKNFSGAEIDTYNGEYSPHSDGRQTQTSFTVGKTTDKGSIVFSASYQNQGAVWTGDRAFSAYPWTDQHPYFGLSKYGPYGYIRSATGGPALVLNPGGD